MNPMQLTTFTQGDKASLVAEILPLYKLHSRIENTDEDGILPVYISGAISAAENYLLRDVWPTTRVWTGDLPLNLYGGMEQGFAARGLNSRHERDFVVRRGRASVSLKDGLGVVLDPSTYRLLSSADPKTWGFQVSPVSDLTGIEISAVLGFPTFAEMPDDLQAFILQAAGAMYEVRELANYGAAAQGVETASYIPTYLLDSWANLTYA